MLSIELTPGGWLEGLPGSQRLMIQQLLDAEKTEEQIAQAWLSRAGSVSTAGFGAGGPLQSFYDNVKREFVAFVCGDPRYAALRAQALKIWSNQGKLGLVSMVAGVVATTVGLAVVAVVPVIALLFSLLAKVGINAFCKTCGVSE